MSRSKDDRSVVSGVARVLLGLIAFSLIFYVPYRYAVNPPGFGSFSGTVYAILFPLSILLASAALLVSFRPDLLARLRGGGALGSGAFRWTLGLYGAGWMAIGMMCVPSLTALTASEPLQGLFAMTHMTAQHVVLGFVAIATAWRPEMMGSLFGARLPDRARSSTASSAAAATPDSGPGF